MKTYIMIYSGNWNDEIDVDGFVMMDQKQMLNLTHFLKGFKMPISVSIGFDDYEEYENGVELLEEMSFEEISPVEYKIIKQFFGTSNDFGDNLILSIKEAANRENINFELTDYSKKCS